MPHSRCCRSRGSLDLLYLLLLSSLLEHCGSIDEKSVPKYCSQSTSSNLAQNDLRNYYAIGMMCLPRTLPAEIAVGTRDDVS